MLELLWRLEEQEPEAEALRQQVFDLEQLIILNDTESSELSAQNQALGEGMNPTSWDTDLLQLCLYPLALVFLYLTVASAIVRTSDHMVIL